MSKLSPIELFETQTKNVNKLKKVKDSIIRDINSHLKRNELFQVELKVRLLALLYSILSESQFTQILLTTPNGFTEQEVRSIRTEEIRTAKNTTYNKKRKIGESWKQMIAIGMGKVRSNWKEDNDLTAKYNTLIKLIDTHVVELSIMRNKIAHGQWSIALNSGNTDVEPTLTKKINDLDVIEVTKWFEIHQYLCFIVRDLIQSPKKGFHNNYWENYVNLTNYIEKSKSWTLEQRLEQLNRRKTIKFKKELFDQAIKEGEQNTLSSIAKNMKVANEPTEKIMEYTGLEKEKIDNL